MSRRTERVNELIRSELSDLMLREVRDPRLGGLRHLRPVVERQQRTELPHQWGTWKPPCDVLVGEPVESIAPNPSFCCPMRQRVKSRDVRHRLMQARNFEGHSKLRAAIRRSFSVRIQDRLPNIEQQLAKD